MHRLIAAGVALVLLAAGCSDDAGEETSAATSAAPVAAPTNVVRPCPAFSGPGEQVHGAVTIDGEDRTYLIDVPPSYDGSSDATLVLNFHGNNSNAEQQRQYTGLADVADAIVVAPQGTGDPQHFSLVPGPDNPDIRFARANRRAGQRRSSAWTRTGSSATGISNGSGLSAEIACAAPDVFAAVALVAATIGPLGCDPSTRMPVLAFHGTADADRAVRRRRACAANRDPACRRAPRSGSAAGRNRTAVTPSRARSGSATTSSTGRSAAATRTSSTTGSRAAATSGRARTGCRSWGTNTETIDASELIAAWFAEHGRG